MFFFTLTLQSATNGLTASPDKPVNKPSDSSVTISTLSGLEDTQRGTNLGSGSYGRLRQKGVWIRHR